LLRTQLVVISQKVGGPLGALPDVGVISNDFIDPGGFQNPTDFAISASGLPSAAAFGSKKNIRPTAPASIPKITEQALPEPGQKRNYPTFYPSDS